MRNIPAVLLALLAVLCGSGGLAAQAAQDSASTPATPADPFKALHFRFLGPIGNRASAIVGEPGNPLVVYIGAASGGIFKTSDGGTKWQPVFDDQDVSAVGALAIAPSRHETVWAGTGEPWLIRPDHAMGDGIYKSTDAGRTWKKMGLDLTGHIARIIVDPNNPDLVFACAVGQAYRPQHERGVFKTTDGGRTWTQALFVNENTGCSELSMDAHDSNTLFAGMWQVDIKTWKLNSGGTGGGVYVSHDAGQTWKKLTGNGLPAADEPVGKTAVQVAPSNPQRVYALIEQKTPTLYRSGDGGTNWTIVNQSHVLAERASYYTRFGVSPDNENLLYFMSVSYSVSRDGGETLARDMPDPAGDNHDVWIDPQNPHRVLVANDQGGQISLDGAKTWYHVVLPISQMYHVAVDNQIPYYVYGNRQDGPSYMGPSNNLMGGGSVLFNGGITSGEWRSMGGCESGFGIPDPQDPNIVWSGCYDGQLDRTDMRTGQSRSVMVWPDAAYGWAPADVKYRWHWTFPITISPHDHNTVYVGSQVVHMTTDGGQSWKDISPDLTLNDKSHEQNSGGLATDNLMTFDGATLYAIAESPLQKGLIWAGTNDGQVQVTRDGGQHWNNVTKNIPNLPPLGTVFNVEPSHFDAGTAYIAVDLEQVGNYDPYVFKTSDFGQTWHAIAGSIPKSVSSFAHCVREDPVRKGMLYLGTDNAIYVSWNDGGSWTHLHSNLPPAPVYWLEIQPHFHDLVVATYGRGFWVLDDLTTLRAWDQTQGKNAVLLPIRAAYRFRSRQDGRAADPNSAVEGENPPYGADINFYLKQAPKQIEIAILGSNNEVARTLRQTPKPTGDPEVDDYNKLIDGGFKAQAGLNRVWWDLRYEPLTPVKLRTSPPGEPWVRVGKADYRPLILWTSLAFPPRVVPGKYTVKLTVDGESFTQPLEVLRDPHTLGSDQDIAAEVSFLRDLTKELDEAAKMINDLEWVRLEAAQRRARTADAAITAPPATSGGAAATAAGSSAQAGTVDDLEQRAIAAEEKLVDVHLTGRIEDSFRHPMDLYGKMMAVLANLGATGADLPPTSQQVEVNREFQQRLAEARQAYQQVMQSAGRSITGGE
jgi:photosystem II stability/assembly factor-like uncharacterized protein